MKRKAMAVFTLMTVAMMMAWAVPALAEETAETEGMLKVNINTADLEELVSLEGIGEAYARRIIEYREKNGPFQAPDDILRVKGVGEKTLEVNKDRIVVK